MIYYTYSNRFLVNLVILYWNKYDIVKGYQNSATTLWSYEGSEAVKTTISPQFAAGSFRTIANSSSKPVLNQQTGIYNFSIVNGAYNSMTTTTATNVFKRAKVANNVTMYAYYIALNYNAGSYSSSPPALVNFTQYVIAQTNKSLDIYHNRGYLDIQKGAGVYSNSFIQMITLTSYNSRGNYIERVSATTNNAYPSNGISGSYWYTYVG